MKAAVDVKESLVEELTTLAAGWSGFSRTAIHVDAIRRAAGECLGKHMTERQLLERAVAGDPFVVSAFRQAVCVGETYFYRSPEHFSFISERAFGPFLAAGGGIYRAWSAACSTGEEAYSIAACLLSTVPAGSSVHLEVLGTDLSPASLRHAEKGEYGAWSVRETAPIPHPLFHRSEGRRISVNAEVRAITKFAPHDLLDPLPTRLGEFNLIFCRNVLVYFTPEAIRSAVNHLASRLLPGGVIVFGVLEVNEPPPGLIAIGGPGMTAFERPLQGQAKSPTRRPSAHARSRHPPSKTKVRWPSQKPAPKRSLRPTARLSLPPVLKSLPVEIKARHMEALALIERNQKREALAVLGDIRRRAPNYVAALLDQALLGQKAGQKKLTAELMHEILRLTKALPEDTVLPGLEELPLAYYRATAEAFLKSVHKEK